MSNRLYDPLTLQAIGEVCREVGIKIVANQKFLDYILVESALQGLWNFLKSSSNELGSLHFAIRFNFDVGKGLEPLSVKRILDSLKKGENVFEVAHNLELVSTTNSLLDFAALSNYSKDENCLLIYRMNESEAMVFSAGIIVKQINIFSPKAAPSTIKKFSKNYRDYKISIIDFHTNRTLHNQHSNHWANKAKRVLEGGLTEKIFHENLWNWLDEHLEGAFVISNPKKVTQDETDLEIKAIGGDYYLIEVKWLGKNKSGTTYGEPKIVEAIGQVKNYLDVERDILEATLVIFDGRPLEQYDKMVHIDEAPRCWKEIDTCLSEKLPEKGKALVLFLENQNASTRPR